MTPVLFADSNVMIEALLIPHSAAYVVSEMVARGVFDLATCQICIEDTEDAIVNKLKDKPAELDDAISSWEKLKADTRIIILPDPKPAFVKEIWDNYLGVMRHRADIPVLAAALAMEPPPKAILSGNREHFNQKVEERCGINIFSCQEFLEFIGDAP